MDDVFSQQKQFFDFIKNEIDKNKISHAYLIESNNYENIDKLIKEFIKFLLCDKKIENQNCTCHLCSLVDEDSYPDVEYVNSVGSTIKKEQLLKVKDVFRGKSLYNNKQIYVIWDATKLNSSSANTILKFLEEPEDNVVAILVADNRYKVLETILSRCQIITLTNKNVSKFDESVVSFATIICDPNKNFLEYDKIIEHSSQKSEFIQFLKNVQMFIFSNIGKNQFLDLSDNKLISIVEVFENIISRLEFNVNNKLLIDDLMIGIDEVVQ